MACAGAGEARVWRGSAIASTLPAGHDQAAEEWAPIYAFVG